MQFFDQAQAAFIEAVCNNDAGATMFFQRQLEQILAKTYEVQYADLPWRNLFPVSTEVNPGADTITYHVMDRVGVAKIIGAYAKDLPRADAFSKEVKSSVKGIGVAFGYNTQELRAAKMLNVPLEQRKANSAARATEELFNSIAFDGDADTGLPGFLSNPNITVTTVPNGAGGNPEWSTKTPDEILFDINALFEGIFTLTLMKERPDTLLLPPAQYSYIVSTPRSANSDTTILQYVVNNSPYIASAANIIPVNQMTGSGAGSTDQMAAYTRSPEKLQAQVPMEQMFLPVQRKGLEFEIPSEARTGGVVIYYPLSVALANSI